MDDSIKLNIDEIALNLAVEKLLQETTIICNVGKTLGMSRHTLVHVGMLMTELPVEDSEVLTMTQDELMKKAEKIAEHFLITRKENNNVKSR